MAESVGLGVVYKDLQSVYHELRDAQLQPYHVYRADWTGAWWWYWLLIPLMGLLALWCRVRGVRPEHRPVWAFETRRQCFERLQAARRSEVRGHPPHCRCPRCQIILDARLD